MSSDQEAELLLQSARVAAEAIGATFGRDCEVAVHDLRQPRTSLVHLVNGHVTGRHLGSPIRDLLLRVIPSLAPGSDVVDSYRTELDDGRTLKATTCILRDSENNPVVALCMNIDITRLRASASAIEELIRIDDAEAQPANDVPRDLPHAADVMDYLIANVIKQFGRGDQMSKSDRLRAVEFLDEKGAFLIKGAVPLVAEAFAVSEPTVYRYLEQVRLASRGPQDDA